MTRNSEGNAMTMLAEVVPYIYTFNLLPADGMCRWTEV